MISGPGARLGPYEILERVGAGGMGDVYRARDTRLRRDVAIKVLSPRIAPTAATRRRFLREARSASGLNHPNICALYDIGEENGVDFLVMEFLEGETLAQKLERSGRLPLHDALRIAREVASALDRAHRQGVVHRDLKPANVMLTSSGVKLLDFGLARLNEGDEESQGGSLTTDGLVVGTLEYMSPEQLNGAKVDARSDIFSFGVLLYEMLTGRRPFTGSNRASIVGAILFGVPEPLNVHGAGLPPALEQLASACLEKDSGNRIQSAHDVKMHLEWVELGAPPSRVPRRRARWISARNAVAALLLTAAVAAGGAAAYNWRPDRERTPVRLDLAPPAPGLEIDWPAVSPDGKLIAFTTRDESATTRLWLRDLATGEVRALPGTDDAMMPFWSPDSRRIAFFSRYNLNVIGVDSAASEVIAAAAAPRGGSWGSTGRVLFAPHVNTGIWMTTGEGTTVRAVTSLDTARKDVTHRWPEFFPDGEHFVFVIRSRNFERSGLYVGSVDRGVIRKISNVQSRAFVAGDGSLVFYRDRKLYRQAFDPGELELKGPPVEIARNIEPDLRITGAVHGGASRTGTLTWATPPDLRSRMTRMSRDGKVEQTLSDPGHFINPALSPDGRTVALCRIDETSGLNGLWLLDTGTARLTPFVVEESNADAPTWSADGRSLLYMSDRRGSYETYERRLNAVANDRLVLPSGTYAQPLGASISGNLFYVLKPDRTSQHLFWPSGAPSPRPLPADATGRSAGAMRLSPDGKWLAFLRLREAGEANGLEITAVDGSGRKLVIGGDGFAQPVWRPDGSEIYFVDPEGYLMAASFRDGDVGAPKRLFRISRSSTYYASAEYAASADGQSFFVLARVATAPRSNGVVMIQ